MPASAPTNIELAEALDQMAELLLRDGEPNPYRVQAYLTAAETLRAEREPVALRYGRGGHAALAELPGIGASLAGHLGQLIESGRAGLRDRLLRAHNPAVLLATVPGISPRLAHVLVEDLGVASLADLERAALDGRLGTIPGVGPRTVEAIRLQLNSILSRSARRRARRLRRQTLQLVARERTAPTPTPDPPAAPHAVIYDLFPTSAAA